MVTIFKHRGLTDIPIYSKRCLHLKEILREKLCNDFINVTYI